MSKYRFFNLLDANQGQEYYDKDARLMNDAITIFNNWQLDGFPADRIERIEAHVERAHQLRNDTWNEQHREILDAIRTYIKRHLEEA